MWDGLEEFIIEMRIFFMERNVLDLFIEGCIKSTGFEDDTDNSNNVLLMIDIIIVMIS